MVMECVECELCPVLMKCPETWREAVRRVCSEALEGERQ